MPLLRQRVIFIIMPQKSEICFFFKQNKTKKPVKIILSIENILFNCHKKKNVNPFLSDRIAPQTKATDRPSGIYNFRVNLLIPRNRPKRPH